MLKAGSAGARGGMDWEGRAVDSMKSCDTLEEPARTVTSLRRRRPLAISAAYKHRRVGVASS